MHFVPAGSKNRYKRLLLDAHTGALLEEVPPERRLEKPRCDRTKLVAGDPVEQSVVKRIYAQYRAGRGYRKIACELNQAGAPCPNGRHWEMSCVKSILENPVYRGALVTGMRREGRSVRCDTDLGASVAR